MKYMMSIMFFEINIFYEKGYLLAKPRLRDFGAPDEAVMRLIRVRTV